MKRQRLQFPRRRRVTRGSNQPQNFFFHKFSFQNKTKQIPEFVPLLLTVAKRKDPSWEIRVAGCVEAQTVYKSVLTHPMTWQEQLPFLSDRHHRNSFFAAIPAAKVQPRQFTSLPHFCMIFPEKSQIVIDLLASHLEQQLSGSKARITTTKNNNTNYNWWGFFLGRSIYSQLARYRTGVYSVQWDCPFLSQLRNTLQFTQFVRHFCIK